MDIKASIQPYNFRNEGIISVEKLNEHRNENKFTDLTLVTSDGSKYHVHKIIISTTCPYFEGLFNSGLEESDKSEIHLDRDISPNNFEAILTYIYTGQIEINIENAFIINENAYYFGLKKLKEASEKKLIENICLENVLAMWRWAEKFSNNELKEMCMDLILSNSDEFFEKNLLILEYNEVLILVSNYEFDQDQLYIYLIKWIKNDFVNREKYMKDLLEHIEFGELSDDLKNNQIKTDTVLLKNINFLEVVAHSILEKANNRKIQHKNGRNMIKNEKIATYLDDLVFAISHHAISVIKFKKPFARIVPVMKLGSNNKTFQPIYNKSDNIMFCGFEEGKSCKNFSYRTNTFNDLSPMLESRQGFGITKLHEKIFVCGGISNYGSIEIYDSNTDKWMYGKSMSKQQPYEFKMLNYNQSIYTFGGSYEYSELTPNGDIINVKAPSEIIQRYDPRENLWETICSKAMEIRFPLEVFAIKDNRAACIQQKTTSELIGISVYDFHNNSMSHHPGRLRKFFTYNFYQSTDYICFLCCDNEANKHFGRINSMDFEITLLKDLNLNSYNGCVKLLNVGPDQDNYLGSMFD